ncbi:hypothetical protein E2320_012124 [Naja naja]|nr:hypothetical protein E2320_012124 [Naja naja]
MATRQLARQLGIIRSVSKPPGGQSHNQCKLRQLFDYLIIIDFESTCWKDIRRCQEITRYFSFVFKHQVDEGVPLHISLSQFSKWIYKIQKEKNIVFGSTCAAPEEKLCAFVTWSDWDLGICLHYECKRKQLRKPNILNSWIDLRATYKSFYSRKPQGLNGALKDVGITFEGREHSGLDDSRNTARLAWKMIRDGCVMKITKSLDEAPPAKNSMTRFGGANPTHGGPLGTNPLVKASTLDGSEKEAAPEIKRKEEDPPQETVRIGLLEDTPVTSRKSEKTDECCSTKMNLTLSIGRPHWALGNLQHPRCGPSGLQSWGSKGHLIPNPSTPNRRLVLVPTTLSTINISETDISTTPDCLSMLANWEDVAIIPEQEDDPDPESSPSKDNPKRALVTEDRNKLMHVMKIIGEEDRVDTPPSRVLSKCIVYKSPNTTIYNAGQAPSKPSDASGFKLPVVTAEASSPNPPGRNLLASSTEAIKRKPSSPKSLPPSKKTSFRIYKDGSPTSSHFLSPGANPCDISPALLSSSGNIKPTFRLPGTRRITPPLCQCGRRARRLNVSNGGPNQGKAFYSCPVRKCERNPKGCNYFRWEDSLIKEKMALPTLTVGAGGFKLLKTQDPSLADVKAKCLNLRPSMRS